MRNERGSLSHAQLADSKQTLPKILQMEREDVNFELKLASTDLDLRASQRLRYKVFVEEFGGNGAHVDHDARIEMDEFDSFADHLILIDRRLPEDSLDHVIGVYRLLRSDVTLGFYSSSEFDLTSLLKSGRKLLELGRSCVHPDYRGGSSMFQLWNGLAEYVIRHDVEILFGVASFHGTQMRDFALPLSYLHYWHAAPDDLRVSAKGSASSPMNLIAKEHIDRKEAVVRLPALIKAYLRLGGVVGSGAFIDYAFNTIDVCVLMDTNRMSQSRKSYYERNAGMSKC